MDSTERKRQQLRVISLFPDVCEHDALIQKIDQLVRRDRGSYVCFSTVHMVMESYDQPEFGEKVNSADIIVTDGMPLVWMQRLQGGKGASRVRANDLMISLCNYARQHGLTVGFYGGAPEVIDAIKERAANEFQGLDVVYAYSPPFRPLTEDEDAAIVDELDRVRPDLLFMGLGCPKQENWMHGHRDRVRSVMLGVGASFDFFAGNVRECPPWLGRLGLEWLFRLTQEPRRLWYRYLVLNPRFIALCIGQLTGLKRFDR